jgi:hypothetical protein
MVESFASDLGFIWLLRNAKASVASSCVYFNPVIALLLLWEKTLVTPKNAKDLIVKVELGLCETQAMAHPQSVTLLEGFPRVKYAPDAVRIP